MKRVAMVALTCAIVLLIGRSFRVIGDPSAIVTAPNGAVGYQLNANQGTITVLNPRTNRVINTIVIDGGVLTAIAVTPDGQKAYVANAAAADSSVIIIDVATSTVIGRVDDPLGLFNSPDRIRIDADGRQAAVINAGDNMQVIIDTATDTVLGAIPQD